MGYKLLPHIIHRQVLDLQLPPNRFDGSIEEHVRNLFYRALPKIETVFSAYDHPGQLTRIDKLFLDLGVFDHNQLDELFSSRLCSALSEAFGKAIASEQPGSVYTRREVSGNVQIAPVTTSSDQLQQHKSLFHEVSGVTQYPVNEGIRQAFFYFLQNGVHPWWMSERVEESADVIFSVLLDQPSSIFITQIKQLLTNDTNALNRLIYQFSDTFIDKLILLLQQDAGKEILPLYHSVCQYWFDPESFGNNESVIIKETRKRLSIEFLLINDISTAIRAWMVAIREMVSRGSVNVEQAQQLLSAASFDSYREFIQEFLPVLETINQEQQNDIEHSSAEVSEMKTISEKEDSNKPVADEKEVDPDESIDKFTYGDYAGLVILHPYLTHFFSGLGLIDEKKQFNDKESQMRAVYLLSFLASGKDNSHEAELPLCKFLCGMPLKIAMIKDIRLRKYETDECEELLRAVINHWSILKNTSPDGLRQGFLNRKGKLDFREEMPVLYVESKPQDVLLERLPWAISYIQLPWMNKPFTTMWN